MIVHETLLCDLKTLRTLSAVPYLSVFSSTSLRNLHLIIVSLHLRRFIFGFQFYICESSSICKRLRSLRTDRKSRNMLHSLPHLKVFEGTVPCERNELSMNEVETSNSLTCPMWEFKFTMAVPHSCEWMSTI